LFIEEYIVSTTRKQRAVSSGPVEPSALPLTGLQEELSKAIAVGDTGVTDAFDMCIVHAVHHNASDIHFEPWEDCLTVRYRLDGMLHEICRIPKQYQERLVARIKILAKMVVYQKNVPQDGRIDDEGSLGGYALRISTFPTIYGEKTVVRVIGANRQVLEIGKLGFRKEVGAALGQVIGLPQGTILLTGPSSAGKTTTIYSMLNDMITHIRPGANVVTIEDPVEFKLGPVAQTQINAAAGFTFDQALRAILRQDPEVIMVGEIRDMETARLAIQAGLTGHLVISTIHSGTAPGVFTRLLDMGIEPYLVASSITAVLAQRLIRLNCELCKKPYESTGALYGRFGIPQEQQLFRGSGCPACDGIGYKGRNAIGELLTVNAEIAELILSRARTRILHDAAVKNHMVTLTRHGVDKAVKGLTTLEELERVLPVMSG
jgi:type II secretory ATPase GspE/PulE/Tfp pilus assembly ATPase PilB-like protein